MEKHNLPKSLKHKPLISVDYYQKDIDNIGAGDAQYLSLGYAQWDDDRRDVSAKIFRRNSSDSRWSRQAEELPVSRVLDLAIFIIDTYKGTTNSETYFGSSIENEDEQNIITNYFQQNRQLFNRQLDVLQQLLNR